MEQKKLKDIKPIILYLCVFFGIQIIGGLIMGLLIHNDSEEVINRALSIVMIAAYSVTFITFLIIYHKKLIDDMKRLKTNNLILIAICTVVLLVLNYLLTNLLVSLGVKMDNQDSIIEMMEYYKPLMILSTVIFAPIVEEILFRYSLSTLFKSNIVFIIISSLIFGLLHGIGIATIVYVLMGAILAYTYIKTDKNVFASSIIHIINNAFGVLSMLIILK